MLCQDSLHQYKDGCAFQHLKTLNFYFQLVVNLLVIFLLSQSPTHNGHLIKAFAFVKQHERIQSKL